MRRAEETDPFEALVRDACRPEPHRSSELVRQALAGRPRKAVPRLIVGVALAIGAAAVVVKLTAPERAAVTIRARGDVVVVERRTGGRTTTETEMQPASAGMIVIREVRP